MAEVRLTLEEYERLMEMAMGGNMVAADVLNNPETIKPKKKRSSAYSSRYKANFRKVAPRFKLKNGNWKKNGFKSAVKLAHKMSKK